MKALEMLVEAGLRVEKVRVQTQVRRTHLALKDRDDKLTDELLERTQDLEKWIDDQTASLIQTHPAYPWFSRIKGIGRENIAKVTSQIDIEKANTISSLWKFTGFSVDNGKAPKPTKGEKLSYNAELRTMCWRLAGSLLRAKGKFYEKYLDFKEQYKSRYAVVPTSKLPKKDGKRYEPEGVISEGHLHAMAQRKMVKLFLACLWIIWRQQEGLPITKPYAIDKLGHNSYIDPWEMTDRETEL